MYIDILKNNHVLHRQEIPEEEVRHLFIKWEEYAEAHEWMADEAVKAYLDVNHHMFSSIRGLTYCKVFKSKIDLIPYDEAENAEPD